MAARLLLIITLLLPSLTGWAQSQFSMFQFGSALPQTNQLNPGIIPEYKVVVGLPVLSSTYLHLNSGGLTMNNAFDRDANDSLHFNPAKLASNLNEYNRLEVNGNTQLLYLGLKVKKNYLSLALAERVDAGFIFPRTLVSLVGNGNGDYLGETVALDRLNLRAQAFHELSVGYSRQLTDKLDVGIKVKFLSGVLNVEAKNVNLALTTTTDSITLTSQPFTLSSANLDLITEGGDIFKEATAFQNRGLAFDIGALYRFSPQLELSAAVLDLGAINWYHNTRQLFFPEVNYTYKGLDLLTLIEGQQGNDLNNELDSLLNAFDPDTVDNQRYRTTLLPKFYVSGTYRLGQMHTFGAIFYGDVFEGVFNPAFGISYTLHLGKIWSVGANWSYRNRSFANFGVGTTLNLGPVQLYLLSENITSFITPDNARLLDVRIGLNLVFDRVKEAATQ